MTSGQPSSVVAPPAVVMPSCREAVATTAGDDWATYAHDQQRTGCETQSKLTEGNVAGLKLKWTYHANETTFASLIAVNGLVYGVTMNTGTVFALDAQTGQLLWQRTLGGSSREVRATPVFADGLLFIGLHDFGAEQPNGYFPPVPSTVYALNAKTGAPAWSQPLQGTMRGVPVVINHEIMVPVAGGDSPACLQGGVDAFDETTGTPKWQFSVDPIANDGGSVWAPMATDGSHLYFGTGNTCVGTPLTANGIVSLDLSGNLAWAFNTANQVGDDDVGGGTLVANGQAVTIGKNGTLYFHDLASGTVLRTINLGVTDGTGGYSTPVSDGNVIVFGTSAAAAGRSVQREVVRWNGRAIAAQGTGGRLMAVDFSGKLLWAIPATYHVYNSSAIADGIVFSDLDSSIVAMDLESGAKLWSYDTGNQILSSPVVVSSGLYTVDSAGNVYKFSL